MSSYLSHKRKGFQDTAPAAFNGFGNRSRSFDGVGDYISIPDNPSLPTGAQTISAWVKTENFGDYADLVSQWDNAGEAGFVILKLQDNQIAFYITNTGSTSGNGSRFTQTGSGYRINVGSWYHVSCVFDPSNSMKIYINGILASTNSNNIHSSIYDSGNDLLIGERADIANRNWHGNIADVRIYDAALTATEISDLYNGTNITTNLVGHWLTDADDTEDKAGSNNGTNYGSKYSYDNPSPPVEFGSASRSFDGVNDYVATANDVDAVLDGAFTIAFWLKLDDGQPSATQQFFGVDNGTDIARILVTTGGVVRAVYRSDNGTVSVADLTTSLTNGQQAWVHYAWVVTPTGQKIYVDGSEATLDGTNDGDMTGVTMGNFATVLDFYIGARNLNGSANQFAAGNYADFRIYDAELTASQISDLYAGTDVETNLVGHWLTDNDDVEDKAGTNDGTNYGSTYSYDNPPMDLVPSRQASRDFNGTSNYVDLGDSDDFSFTDGAGNDQPFSLSCWVNMDTNNKFRVLHKSADLGGAITNELFFGTIGSGSFCFLISGNSNWYGINTPTAIAQNEWVHISATYDGSGGANFRDGMHIYINGVAISHVDFGSTGYPQIANNIYPLWIGKYQNNDTYADGRIADVRIYDAELTASQILDIYNGTTDRTNLIGQWLTNSDDVLDHAGNNDGTNVGSTYSTDSPS